MEPATIVLGDLFVVSLSNHKQLQPSVTSLLFLRWPWWVFYKASDRIPWHAAWTLLLLLWEGDCWVFPAVSCSRSCTQLLQHTESTLEIEGFFPSIYLAVEISQSPELPYHWVCLCIPHNQDFAHVEQFITTSTLLQSAAAPMKGRMGFFSLWEVGKAVQGDWQCDQNHVQSLCWSIALKAHILGWVRGLTTLVPLALLLNSWLGWSLWQPEHGCLSCGDPPLAANWSGTFIIGNGDGFCRLYWLWSALDIFVCHLKLVTDFEWAGAVYICLPTHIEP